MCFSNLPVEFDEHGNPYLADEADDVDRPRAMSDDEPSLDEDPRGAYAEIVNDLPEGLRASLAAESDGEADSAETGDGAGDCTCRDAGDDSTIDATRDDQRESARGD